MRTPTALALVLTACLGLACGEPRTARNAAATRIESCSYDVTVAGDAVRLEVAASCRGGKMTGFSASEHELLPFIRDVKSNTGQRLRPAKTFFGFQRGTESSGISYEVDLGAAAESFNDFDFAQRVGASLVAPASSFLLVPEPVTDIPVTLNVRALGGTGFATALEPRGAGFSLDAHEIPFATYSFFGRLARETVELPGAKLDVVTLDGPMAATPEVRAAWIVASARAVADFYGRFPVPRAVIGIVPVPDRGGVVFGKVRPESAPGIVMRIGARATELELYADWMLVHELFHLGFPSFRDEGKWLDEGLATYFEPIIRARAGFIGEGDVWREFASSMPYGLSSVEAGLENANDYRGLYWGGAIVCLLADVEARRATNGARGLEAGLVSVLEAGGNASTVWPLSKTIAIIDGTFDKPIVLDLARAYGKLGGKVELDALFAKLGVRETASGVTLDDSAPLAKLRAAIVRGSR